MFGGFGSAGCNYRNCVHGNRRIPAETVRARIFSRAGDVYDAAALERDFNSLWNTGYFEDIRFEREQTPKGWRIHVYVKERPTISEIEYLGLNSVSKSDVLDRFKDRKVGLSPESQYDPTKIKKAEVTIKELLSEHGRQFATVRTEVRPIPPAKVSVTFVVKEGPKVSVGKITFMGNKHVNSRILRAAMKNLKPIGIPHSIFLENIFAKTYDATKLDEDTERVRAEFQNRGYFKVLVQDAKTEIHDTGHAGFHIPLLTKGPGKSVDITIPIDEGEQYRLGSITFNGNKEVTNVKALRALFPMKDGDIFSREKVAKGLDNLRDAYRQLGHINFTSIPNTTFDEDKKLVFLSIDIDEGKKFYRPQNRIQRQHHNSRQGYPARSGARRRAGLRRAPVEAEPAAAQSVGVFRTIEAGRPERHRNPSRRKERHGGPDAEGQREGQEQHRPEWRRERAGRRLYRDQLQHQ